MHKTAEIKQSPSEQVGVTVVGVYYLLIMRVLLKNMKTLVKGHQRTTLYTGKYSLTGNFKVIKNTI